MEGCRNYKSEELWAVTKSSSRSGCRRKAYMEVAKPKHTLRHSRGMPPKTLSVFGNGFEKVSINCLNAKASRNLSNYLSSSIILPFPAFNELKPTIRIRPRY